MNNQVQMVQDKVADVYGRASETAQKTFHAGLGVVALAQDELKDLLKEGENFANKLVERGEALSKERREQLNKQVEESQTQVKDFRQKATENFDTYTEKVLTRAHIPTSKEIEELNKQVASLNRKVDKLRKEQEKVAA